MCVQTSDTIGTPKKEIVKITEIADKLVEGLLLAAVVSDLADIITLTGILCWFVSRPLFKAPSIHST